YYAFQNIPNDYFLVKPSLPKDPSRIKTQNTYTYPITDDTEAATFIHEVKRTYKITLPISELIMTANSTNKPRLPTDPKMITEVNLTIPIDTPKRITETAHLLRPHYYFQKLPTEWIQILETNNKTIDEMSANKEAKPKIPDTIAQIQEDLKTRKIDTTDIILPITNQDTATLIITKLKQHYTIKAIPEHILKLPPLPEPEWKLF